MYDRLSCHSCASPTFSNTEMDCKVASKWPMKMCHILRRPELLKQLRWAGRRSSRLAQTALPFSIHAPPGSGTQNNYKIIMIMYLRKHLYASIITKKAHFPVLCFLLLPRQQNNSVDTDENLGHLPVATAIYITLPS